MARSGITYSQVAAAADRLFAEDQKPTIDRVRIALGNTGSPNTIHKHLTAWKAASPVIERTVPALPTELQAALVREIQRQSGEARADALDEKNIAQENADRLADAGELLEAEIGDLRETNQALLSEQQRFNAQLDERGGELTRLSCELTRERDRAEDTRTQLAQAWARIESHEADADKSAAALDRQAAAARSAEATHLETLQTVAIERTRREGLEDQKTGLEKRLADEKAAYGSALEKIVVAAEKREVGLTNQVNKLTEKLTGKSSGKSKQ